MANYTEKQIIEQIEIVGNTIQVRTDNVIEKDGIEISRTFNRHILVPTDDISNENEKVKAIANAIWTKEVVDAFIASAELEQKVNK